MQKIQFVEKLCDAENAERNMARCTVTISISVITWGTNTLPSKKKKHSPVETSSPIYVELYPDAEVNGSLMRHAESQNFLSPRLPHGRSLRWSWRLAVENDGI